jgi:hypothetical protein
MTRATAALVAGGALAASAALPAAAAAATVTVTTKSAQDVTATGATLRGTVGVSVLGANVTFQYGTTTAYGLSSATVTTSLLGIEENIQVAVSGLQPSTTYHVRAIATSGLSLIRGRDVTFTTGGTAGGQGPGGSGGPGSGTPTAGSGSPGSGTPGPGSPTSGPGSPAASGSGASSGTGGASGSGASGTGAASSASPSTTAPASAGGAPATAAPGSAAKPVLGRTVAVAPVSGTVTATTPSGAPIDLTTATALPSGTLIDTRKGAVELTSALDRDGGVQTGRFWGALFEVRQSATGGGMTQLVLRGGDFSGCRPAAAARRAAAAARAGAARAKKPPRTLWGSDSHGRFQTRGRGSVATVRGTRWVTEDRCEGTLTRVTAGAVAVYDLRRRATKVVTRGHRYLARVAR